MRVLHTADWHLGKLFHQVHLTDDQAHVLDRFVELAGEARPDLVVVAGDVFDRAVPPGEAVELLDDVLSRLVLDVECRVVMIPGNHDDPARLGFGARLLGAGGLNVLTEPAPEPLELEAEDGPVWVVAVPYRHPAVVARAVSSDLADYDEAAAAVLERARRALPANGRTVVVAHQWVVGAEVGESERPLTLGGTGQVALERFAGFDYVALGHLHRPQQLDGGRVRYPGSLLPYHFSEAEQEKGVTIADIDATGARTVEHIPLAPRRRFVRIRGRLRDLLRADPAPDEREAWVQAVLTDQGPVLDAAARLREVYPNVLAIEREAVVPTSRGTPARREPLTLDRQFAAFFEDATGEALPDDAWPAVRKATEDID